MWFINCIYLWLKWFHIWVHLVSVLSSGLMVLPWQEQREATCRLGQLGYRNVHISEQHKWNQIFPTGKICWKYVSVSQGPTCSHTQEQKGFCRAQHDLSFSGCTEPKWYRTRSSTEGNPAGQHMLEKHLNNHFFEQSSTWISPSAIDLQLFIHLG